MRLDGVFLHNFSKRSGGISAVVLTFQTAVPFLADASCLAAPAPAFVAIALANAEDEALKVNIDLPPKIKNKCS